MGLVLASSESFDSDLSESLSYLAEHRHLQGRPHHNPQAKHPRRPFQWSRPKSLRRHDLAAPLTRPYFGTVPAPLPHHLALYHANLTRHRRPHTVDPYFDNLTHHATATAARKYRQGDAAEGVALARCEEVRLPGEGRRMPSLERQDAFRDGNTAKRKRVVQAQYVEEVGDEELYRRGILYDDEYERGEGFSLAEIVHDASAEVGWNVRYRPAKRRGRAVKREGGRERGFEGLELALSFARLGEDEALAEWLMAPGEEEVVYDDEGEEEEEVVVEGEEVAVVEDQLVAPVEAAEEDIGDTIEQRVERIKKRVAELPGAHQTVRAEESIAATVTASEEQEECAAVVAEEPVVVEEETIEQRVARIRKRVAELTALHQEDVEDEAVASGDEKEDVREYEEYIREPHWQDVDNNDNDDWAFLDVILDCSGNGTATAVYVDADADDAWIMLGSDGS